MKKLSQEDTKNLVDSYVQTFGQSGAAKKLSEKGYRSPEGAPIMQAHIYRILNGSSTCLLAPDQENQQQEPSTTEEPIAAVPKRTKQIAAELFEDEELLRKEIVKTGEQLREELIEEEAALQEMERSMPPLIPSIGDRPHREPRHLDQDIKISAVFDRRQPVEFQTDDEGYEESYFGIPRLKRKSVEVKSRPHQPKNFGANLLTTRDLNVRPKNRS